MRNLAFLALGIALVLAQGSLFRLLDGLQVGVAAAVWVAAVVLDVVYMVRLMRAVAHARPFSAFRPSATLPGTVVLGYALLVNVAHTHVGRPLPALVLPLILFMGVHEYSLARGALVAAALGYATDVLGVAPVGLYTFTYVATFLLARAAGVRLAAQTTGMQVLLAGAFAILQSTMVLVLLAIFGHDAWVPRSLYPLALPHAVATAAIAPGIFSLCQGLHGANASTMRSEAAGGGLS
jgi:rod shape-determining protein MreD